MNVYDLGHPQVHQVFCQAMYGRRNGTVGGMAQCSKGLLRILLEIKETGSLAVKHIFREAVVSVHRSWPAGWGLLVA